MDKREEIPKTFRDVPEEIRTKARTLAITVLNMEDVEMVTGFMAGVLLHTASRARSQAYEHAAQIVETYIEYIDGWGEDIAEDIRQHSQKGEK